MYEIFPRRYDWMSTVVVKLGGGWLKHFWNVHLENRGRWTYFDVHIIFSDGVVQPPTRRVSLDQDSQAHHPTRCFLLCVFVGPGKYLQKQGVKGSLGLEKWFACFFWLGIILPETDSKSTWKEFPGDFGDSELGVSIIFQVRKMRVSAEGSKLHPFPADWKFHLLRLHHWCPVP